MAMCSSASYENIKIVLDAIDTDSVFLAKDYASESSVLMYLVRQAKLRTARLLWSKIKSAATKKKLLEMKDTNGRTVMQMAGSSNARAMIAEFMKEI